MRSLPRAVSVFFTLSKHEEEDPKAVNCGIEFHSHMHKLGKVMLPMGLNRWELQYL